MPGVIADLRRRVVKKYQLKNSEGHRAQGAGEKKNQTALMA